MKSLLSFWLAGLLAFCSQLAQAQPTVFAGPQVTWAKYIIRDVKQQTESKTGYMAGVNFNTLIEGPVYFSPLFYYSQKGYKVAFDRPAFPPDSGAVNNNVRLHTFEIAPLIQVRFSNRPSYGFVRFGPALDINLSGHEEFDSTSHAHISRPMTFSFGDYSYATTMLDVHLGFQHRNGLTIFAQYVFGFGSLNNADFGPKIFHRAAGLSLGWRFGQKR